MAERFWLTGQEVSLAEMLDGRERRAGRQAAMQRKNPGTLVCFTLALAGPVKVFPLAEEYFLLSVDWIQETLWRNQIPIREKKLEADPCGWEAYFSVDGEAEAVKRLLQAGEESPAGRLRDIDVLRADGSKVSRADLGCPPRRCLLCGRPGAVCARSRTHTVEELQDRTVTLLLEELRGKGLSSDLIGRLCRQAMILEVNTTPKPGLVDRSNNGAHRDMDIPLFRKSIGALEPYFVRFAAAGRELYEEAPEEILRCIRPIGLEAEEAMFAATGGVNTHKGLIFSMGILAAATGYCLARRARERPSLDLITRTAGLIAGPAWKRDFDLLEKKEVRTAGEEQYLRYGIGGIRQEAAEGFPSIAQFSWPVLSRGLARGEDYSEAGSRALLTLIAHVTDTNMIARSSPGTAAALREEVRQLLERPGGVRESEIRALDEEFIRLGVSPGGCADLLALTFYLYELARLL